MCNYFLIGANKSVTAAMIIVCFDHYEYVWCRYVQVVVQQLAIFTYTILTNIYG